MAEDALKRVLKDLGLTDSEVEIYLFVSKHTALSGTDAAHMLRKDKAQVFRLLKSLQTKGFVESTLEAPMRFTPVAFEQVLELTIKAKKDEAANIEKAKSELLAYWKNLSRRIPDDYLERFVIIEGRNKVYSKISEMISKAKECLSATSTYSELFKAEQFGAFDNQTRKKENPVQFHLLVDSSGQNFAAANSLLKSLTKKGFKFEARKADLSLRGFPRMIVRDNEEVLFLIAPPTNILTQEDKLCLWTNCRNLVNAFTFMFEDHWRRSTDILDETESKASEPTLIATNSGDVEENRKKYEEILSTAREEIFIITSPQGLIRIWKNEPALKECAKKGVSVKIIAPIISENHHAAQQLSGYSEVKHVPTGLLETTIVDEKHLFQFNNSRKGSETIDEAAFFENTSYSNNLEYVKEKRNRLEHTWKNASPLSITTLEKILNPPEQKMLLQQMTERTEISGKKLSSMVIPLRALSIIQPPSHLKIPPLVVEINESGKESTFGASLSMTVFLRFETPSSNAPLPIRYISVPVAVVDTNPHPALMMVYKTMFAKTPAEKNVMIVKPAELELYKRGNTVFAGWTVSIPLPPTTVSLPPSCLMFEKYGKLKRITLVADFPSGYKMKQFMSYHNSFLTYLSPSWSYTGSGIEAIVSTHTTRSLYAP